MFKAKSLEIDVSPEWNPGKKAPPSRRRKELRTTGQLSDLFDRHVLAELEIEFANSPTVYNSLSTTEFREVMSKYIPLHLVDDIYRSIDVNDIGFINYSDFTNYLISAEEGSSFSSKTYATRLVVSMEQEEDDRWTHKDMIDCMVYVKKPCAMIITGGRDGQLSLWNAETLQLITHIAHRDKNSVYEEELHRGMNKVLKAKCAKMSATAHKRKNSKVAITSLSPLLNTGLLCAGSADGCVTIYDIGTQDVCGRYTDLEYVPTCIECFYRKQTFHFADAAAAPVQDLDAPIPHIAIGDSEGGVHVIKLHVEFGLSTEVGMKKKNQILFAQSVEENCTKYNVLSSWVTQMRFSTESDALIAACANGLIYFVDILRGVVLREYTSHSTSRAGVRTFSWSAFNKYIVSGADRTILFWDLFTLETVHKIENLKSPVVTVDVQDEQNKVFAILSNKAIFVWHNVTYELLQTVMDATFYKPLNTLTMMAFAPDLKVLFTAGHKITSWTLERSAETTDAADTQDLCCALYNQVFNQVVTVKSLGVVKIYQAETGEIVRQFSVLPINAITSLPMELKPDKDTGQVLPVIKTACFDKLQSRLIVISHDMTVQFWNINDGNPLLQVTPQLYSTTLAHTYAPLPKALSTLGFELTRAEAHKKPKKFLLIGTDHGNLCGYQESNSEIDPCPTFFLRLTDFVPTEHVVHHQVDESANHKGRLNTLVAGMVQNKRAGSVMYGSPGDIEAGGHAAHGVHGAAHPSRQDHGHGQGHHGSSHHPHGHGHGQGHSHVPLHGHHGHDAHGDLYSHHAPAHHAHDDGHHLPSSGHHHHGHGDGHDMSDLQKGSQSLEEGSHTSVSVGSKRSAAKELHHSTDNAVVWTQMVDDTNILLVGYLHGVVALWDLDKVTRLHDLPMHQFGPVLVAMRTRDFLKQAQIKQNAALSRFKRPLFTDAMFSSALSSGGPTAGATGIVGSAVAPPPLIGEAGAPLPQPLVNRSGSTTPRMSGIGTHAASSSALASATAADRISPGGKAKNDGRLSLRGSKAPSEDSAEDVRMAEVSLPKLNFSRGDETSAAKLLTGSKVRKISSLKMTAQRVSVLRRATAMMLPFGLPAHRRDGTTVALGGAALPRTESGASSDEEDSEKGPSGERDGADHDEAGDTAPALVPMIPMCPPSKAAFKHRDSAAVALSGAEMERLKKGMVVGNKANSAHRRLSVAFNPYKQAPPAAGQVSAEASVAAGSSVVSASAKDGDGTHSHGTATPHRRACDQVAEAALTSLSQEPSVASAESSQILDASSSVVEADTEHAASTTEEAPAKISVDSLVLLPQAQVIVGACSDKYLRFWDLETYHILCSCLYYHVPDAPAPEAGASQAPQGDAVLGSKHHRRHHHHHAPKKVPHLHNLPPSHAGSKNVDADEVLRIVKVSDCEDLLIGAYDNGMVRTWSIQTFSLVTLKGLLRKYLSATAAAAAAAEAAAHNAAHGGAAGADSGVHQTGAVSELEELTSAAAEAEATNPFGSGGGALNFGFGAMAMSPITLLHEWQAHGSPFLSIEYVWFDKKIKSAEEDSMDTPFRGSEKFGSDSPSRGGPGGGNGNFSTFGESAKNNASPGRPQMRGTRGTMLFDHQDLPPVARSTSPRKNQLTSATALNFAESDLPPMVQQKKRVKREKNSDMGNDILEGFIMTAGLDQQVYLWNLSGRCVGQFGAYGWEIGNESSWFKGVPADIRAKQNAMKAKNSAYTGDFTAMQEESTKASNITKDSVLVRTPSTILIQNISKQRTHTSKQLNDYVEALCEKISNKAPAYLDVDAHFNSVMTNHPMTKIKRKHKK